MSFSGRARNQRPRLMRFVGLVLAAGVSLHASPPAAAATPDLLDLRDAVVVTSATLTDRESAAIDLLLDEVEKRTIVRWRVVHEWPSETTPAIAVGTAATAEEWAGRLGSTLGLSGPSLPAEGFRIRVVTGSREAPAVLVSGNDARGMLFGIGRLLQELRMSREHSRQVSGRVDLPADFEVTTAPRYPLRGHQLGYRPLVNSYDGWTVEMFEQYYRDLVVFGANAVELIPPTETAGGDDSPHFPLPMIDMMVEMSRLADVYDLDVWLWIPAMEDDYTVPGTVERSLDEWEGIYRRLPRIDVIFVAGGDPGHTPPRVLFPLLEKQTERLRRHHPEAEMWMSPQSFDRTGLEDFYELVGAEPEWLGGIAAGPQIRDNLETLRERVPDRYPIRRYPDLTHSLSCQYPVHEWDRAYALTEHREVTNPRPLAETTVFRRYQETAVGITYSEGIHDDVNKVIWSALGWDPDVEPYDTLRRFSRYFIGPGYTDTFAQGLLALERNWAGPLLTNQGVETTLRQFQALERGASPQDLLNWRFQQGLYRAYYDAYNRRRLLFERSLEEEAMDTLRSARSLGALRALARSEAVLERAVADRVAPDLRQRVFELAEAQFQSIRAQLDVERYKAIRVGRGANLALIDRPLNNRLWLRERFAAIRAEEDEKGRLAGIQAILDWTNPGPGGFYDDLGTTTAQPHLLPGKSYDEDPQYVESPQMGFGCPDSHRLSWCDHADGLFDYEVKLHYPHLDPEAAYRVRVVYSGRLTRRGKPVTVRLTGDGVEIHPEMPKPDPIRAVEYDVPAEVTGDGELTLGCTATPGRGGGGRGCQIAEVWLMRKGPGHE